MELESSEVMNLGLSKLKAVNTVPIALHEEYRVSGKSAGKIYKDDSKA